MKGKVRWEIKGMSEVLTGSCKRKREYRIEEDDNTSLEIWDQAEGKLNIRHFISVMMDLHK